MSKKEKKSKRSNKKKRGRKKGRLSQSQVQLPVIEADPEWGLTSLQVKERVKAGYQNTEVESSSKSVKQIVLSNIFTFFNIIFFILAIAIIAVGSWYNLTFMIVVICNIAIGIVQELRSKKKLDELNLLTNPQGKVIRDKEERTIPVHQAVRDDIAVFSAGDQIYADAVVVEGSCVVNESLLTGEADELTKNEGDNLLSGSYLISGTCKARLTAVGRDSYMSQLTIQAKQQKKQPKSGMMTSLDHLVMVIGIIIIPLGLLMGYKEIFILGNDVQTGVVNTVASLVGMIPEGLYLLTSLALVAGVLRLAQKKTLVHEMACIETLARVDTLCVDKTGTITEPKMVVEDLVSLDEDLATEEELRTVMSDYVYAMQNDNETMDALKRYFTDTPTHKATQTMPFSSSRKYGGAAFARNGTYLVGAPENILGDQYVAYQEIIEHYSEKGCRVMLLAGYDGKLGEGPLTGEVTALGLILLNNKIRPEAPETFKYFREQGVAVKVISGDNPVTVSEVARRADIPHAEKYVDARTLQTDEQIQEAAETYTVFGRVTPDQKRKLVRAMHNAGHTVAMTGDGVNDVLALKEADCSVAMASGSQVACQVSHIVLMESNFAAMPSVVAEGRRVINNIERSASLYLVKNIFSLCLAVVSLLFTFTYPFSPSQLSLISTVTIGIPSFVLAMEPNNNRVKGKFLPNVIYRALPSAFSDLILTIGIVLFYIVFDLTKDELATICTVVVGVVGLLMVYRTCKPFNSLRKALMVFCVVAFIVCATLFQDIFTISWELSTGAWLIMAVFILLSFEISLSANVMVDAVNSWVHRLGKLITGLVKRLTGNADSSSEELVHKPKHLK